VSGRQTPTFLSRSEAWRAFSGGVRAATAKRFHGNQAMWREMRGKFDAWWSTYEDAQAKRIARYLALHPRASRAELKAQGLIP
jgi:hypothetical protein